MLYTVAEMIRIQKAVHLRAHLICYSDSILLFRGICFPRQSILVFQVKSNPEKTNGIVGHKYSRVARRRRRSREPIQPCMTLGVLRTFSRIGPRFKRSSKFRGCEAGKITRTFSGCRCSLLVLLSPLCVVFEQAHFRHWNHPISLFLYL